MTKIIINKDQNFNISEFSKNLKMGLSNEFEVQCPGEDLDWADILVKKDGVNGVAFTLKNKADGSQVLNFYTVSPNKRWRFLPLAVILIFPVGLVFFGMFIYKYDGKLMTEVKKRVYDLMDTC